MTTTVTTTFRIEGLRGSGSGMVVDDLVEDLPGVASCRTDARRGHARVTHDPAVLTAGQIVAALANAGYRVLPAEEGDGEATVAEASEPSPSRHHGEVGDSSAPGFPALGGLRRTRRVLWAAVAVSAPVTLLVVALATRPPAATKAVESPLVGKRAPEVSTTTIDGEPFALSELRGRWTLVNFFATWCVPCRTEHPELVRFDDAHRRAGDAAVVGIVYDDSAQAVREFRAREGGSWPMLVDPKGRIALDFGVAGVPESYLVSPQGVVVAKVVGGVRAPDLERLLAQAKQSRT